MQTKKEQTGYPSIDKPWLKYYSKKMFHKIEAKNTLYNNFKKVAISKPDSLAFIDYKTEMKFTYGQLLSQIDSFAHGMAAIGMNKNCKIGMLGFNSIADPIVLLGGNKIGATVVFVDPDGGALEIEKSIQSLDALVLENIFAEMEPVINRKEIPTVICGMTHTSLRSNCIDYESFINKSKGNTEACGYEENHPALVVFSSGSTGSPKPIVHSDFTVNAAVNKMLHSDFPITEDNLLIKAIPSHIGLGVVTTMCTALFSGVAYIQLKGLPDPSVGLMHETLELLSDYKQWLCHNNIEKSKGVLLFAAPFFAKFLASQIDSIKDMSMVNGILLGGAKMEKDELEQMEDVFAQKGLSVPICNGYGQNEMGGAVALNTVAHNKNGSAGYPVFNTNVRIVNRNTLEDVPLNTVGQILEQSDSKFLYYLDMPEKTEKSKIVLADGSEWYDSTDLGYMDEDGFIYITGRTTRVVIKTDHKVSMDAIEEKIKDLDFVTDAAVVPYGKNGDIVLFACVSNSLTEEKFMETLRTGEANLSTFELPIKLIIVDNLPRMNNGKVDYQSLEKEAEKF